MFRQYALMAGGFAIALALSHASPGRAMEDPAQAASSATSDLQVMTANAPPIVTPQMFPPEIAAALGLPQQGADDTALAEAETDNALGSIAGRGVVTTNVAVALTEQSLSAVNTGNNIIGNTVGSGAISLQDSALSGFNGIGNIMMNTGHNNNLQSNMSVTIVITP